MDGSGSYGTNGNDDVAFEAALLSRELRRPVRVQWMREDEHGWDPKGPPQLLDLRAHAGRGRRTSRHGKPMAMVPGEYAEPAEHPAACRRRGGARRRRRAVLGPDSSLNADPPYADRRTCAPTIKWLEQRRCGPRTCARRARSAMSLRLRAFSTNSRPRRALIRWPIRLRQLTRSARARGSAAGRRDDAMDPRAARADRNGGL